MIWFISEEGSLISLFKYIATSKYCAAAQR